MKAGEKMFDIKKVDDAINRIADGIAAEENSFKSFDGIHLTAELTTALAELITAEQSLISIRLILNLIQRK